MLFLLHLFQHFAESVDFLTVPGPIALPLRLEGPCVVLLGLQRKRVRHSDIRRCRCFGLGEIRHERYWR